MRKPRILIAYSTNDGHTLKICQRLRQAIEPSGVQVKIVSVTKADLIDLGTYDKIVVVASIRRGRHSKAIHEFIDGRADDVAAKPNAFFSVNIVARKPDKNRPEANPTSASSSSVSGGSQGCWRSLPASSTTRATVSSTGS